MVEILILIVGNENPIRATPLSPLPSSGGGTPPHCPHATTDGQDSTTSTDSTPLY